MATIDTSGRPAYMYDEDTDTWYAVSGRVSTSANYVWTGAQQFTNNVRVDGGLTVTSRINSFLNPAARAAAISSPQTGLITFLQQDDIGNTINRFEYWNGSAWVGMPDLTSSQTLTNKTLTSPEINTATTTGSINQQSGTSYTLAISDRDKIVELNNANPITLTVPTDSVVNFPVGSNVSLLQTGAGQVTVGGAGVTINSNPGLKLSGQWAAATLIKRTANTWVLIGNTAS
jgi:hypothetical protein